MVVEGIGWLSAGPTGLKPGASAGAATGSDVTIEQRLEVCLVLVNQDEFGAVGVELPAFEHLKPLADAVVVDVGLDGARDLGDYLRAAIIGTAGVAQIADAGLLQTFSCAHVNLHGRQSSKLLRPCQ